MDKRNSVLHSILRYFGKVLIASLIDLATKIATVVAIATKTYLW